MIDTEELERRMRPRALSTEGFLGEDERLEEVLEADRLTLTELGLTHGQITEPLERLLGMVVPRPRRSGYEHPSRPRREPLLALSDGGRRGE